MGESACPVAGPRPELVGRAVPMSVLDRGACLDVVLSVVLSVGAPPSLHGAVQEVVLAPPTTSRALFPGYTLQPLGDGPCWRSWRRPALRAFFPVEEAPTRDQPGVGDGPEPQEVDPDLAWSATPTRTTSTF